MTIPLTTRVFMLFLTCAILSSILSAQAAALDNTTTITLDQPVHFLAPDGSDVLVTAGTYEAEAAQAWIRLIPDERENAVLLEALPMTHKEAISSPLALSLSGKEEGNPDVHHLMMLLTNGSGLEAIGTYSGIRSKGLLSKVTPTRVSKAIRWGATSSLHAGYNQAMDQGKVALQQGKLPRDIRAGTPAFQHVLNLLSKDLLLYLADTHLKETRQALDGFHVSVTQLAIAINGR